MIGSIPSIIGGGVASGACNRREACCCVAIVAAAVIGTVTVFATLNREKKSTGGGTWCNGDAELGVLPCVLLLSLLSVLSMLLPPRVPIIYIFWLSLELLYHNEYEIESVHRIDARRVIYIV